jgi:cytochrome c-type biogenesis protein CcmH
MNVTRRQFLGSLAAAVATAGVPTTLFAQQENTGAANVPMDENRYRPVRLAAKSARPSMTNAQRDELEHQIHCQCGCNLDVYTCRTTDFSCEVSPAMHRDVMALVAGGYSAQEILDAFVGVYGERVLMAPKKTGFNWAGYLTPFAALAGGAAFVLALLRRWHARAAEEPAVAPLLPAQASPEELARLESMIRSDKE